MTKIESAAEQAKDFIAGLTKAWREDIHKIISAKEMASAKVDAIMTVLQTYIVNLEAEVLKVKDSAADITHPFESQIVDLKNQLTAEKDTIILLQGELTLARAKIINLQAAPLENPIEITEAESDAAPVDAAA